MRRARSRCEYCRAPQVITGVTFHVEHIIPVIRGGIDNRANLALSCVTCNGHKSDHITAVDPQTKAKIGIFHPRLDQWARHFSFSRNTLRLEGITAKGRATVVRLKLNERKQIEARALWVELGIYP